MFRKIWIVLGAVALITTASDVGPFAGDEHPPADIVHAAGGFDQNREADIITDGMFEAAVSYVLGGCDTICDDYGCWEQCPAPSVVAVGDFNEDGRQDLVTANRDYSIDFPAPNSVTVLLGRGDGTFDPAVSYPDGISSATFVAVGDFNQDGHQDLVSRRNVRLGFGDGTFAEGLSYNAGEYPVSVTVGDFNRDGRQDLVAAEWGERDLYEPGFATVLLGHGDGTFAPGVRYAVDGQPNCIVAEDLNQDDLVDLVTGNSSTSQPCELCDPGDPPGTGNDLKGASSLGLTVLLGRGDGTFAAEVSYSPSGRPPNSVTVGDFNEDGWPDLATTNTRDPRPGPGLDDVSVLTGHGDGTFVRTGTKSSGEAPLSIAVGDFNRDGREDLVATNANSDDDVKVLLGLGDGTFEDGGSYAAGDDPRSVALGDFNRDGRPDLVTATYPNAVTVLINQDGPLPISVDIKPDRYPNTVNPYARGVIPVAILGSETLDVADVDVTTLAFGPDGAPIAHLNGHLQDVNYDGIMDLLTHYRTQETGIACGDESATLTGETLDGQPFEGIDSIQTVGCRETRRPAIWMKDQDRPDTGRRHGPVNIERK